jgi:hypothetical protein
MLKRLTTIVVTIFVLLVAFTSAYADNFPGTSIPTGTDTSTIISNAETNYSIANKNQPALDAQQSYDLGYIAPPHELQITVKYNGLFIPTNYGELTYGRPHGDYSGGHYRYVGYTYEGDNYTNIAYPPDTVPNGANFETEQWITQPWTHSTLGAMTVVQTPWEGQTSYTDQATGQLIPTSFLLQVGMYYLNQTTGVGGVDGKPGTGYTFDLGDGNQLWQNLYEYADIMMPPTRTTWGMARMFHMYNNYFYYVDIPMPPLALTELPFLFVSPPSAAIGVGATQQFDALYFYSGQETRVTTSSYWTDDNPSVASIVYRGSNAGLATGVAVGSANITCSYVDASNNTLTGTAVLNVQSQQPVLIVTPSSQAINVGDRADYTAILYPDSQDATSGANGTVVTSSSTWTDDDSSVASVDAGVATGVGVGTTTVTASYTPSGGSALTSTAGLAVHAQQPPPAGRYSGTLSFQAVNQSNIKTLYGQQVGGTLRRGPNIALWTDTVTAILEASQQPDVSPYVPAGGVVTGVTWSIGKATLTYPAQNPDYIFDNPVEPTATTSAGLTPGGHQATASFEENWSEDGIGYGSSGPSGIYDTLTGLMAATTPKGYSLSATFTLNGTVSGYVPTREPYGDDGWTITDIPFGPVAFSVNGTATQALWVCGTGAVPVTGTGGHLAVVACLANPQTHP